MGLGEFGSLCGKAGTPILLAYLVLAQPSVLCAWSLALYSAMAAIEHHFRDYLYIMCMVIRYLPVTSAIIVSVRSSGLVYTDVLVLKSGKK